VILKVVNASDADRDTEIVLDGVQEVDPAAQSWVLTSANPDDENSLAEPMKVAPVAQTIENAAPRFRHVFPAHSLTVARFKVRP
jgi:alpha-L-arabinofuranosidase